MENRSLGDVGGTPGGLGPFLIGSVMACLGGYFLANQVSVVGSYWSFYGANTFGITLVPMLLGVGILFWNGRSLAGWIVSAAGALFILAGVIANMSIYFRPTSLFNTLVMLILLVGGLGLVARLALGAGDESLFTSNVEKLRTLEHREGDSGYWSLETNTPFYGWGFAGRVETTALALKALASSENTVDSEALISRGLLFLLRNQDRYGIWYSTQATINVLDAMASLTSRVDHRSTQPGNTATVASNALVSVDGKQVLSIDLPPAIALTGPLGVDISRFLSPGKHQIEIRRPPRSSRASVQVLADFYVPWTHTSLDSDLHHEAKASEALRLTVHFNKQTANVGESVECSVDAERIGFRGYGMLLAEIGLPPGAEVDRSSLEQATEASLWEINDYDVLPDRLIVYLWPRAGGTKFSFNFKPRFGLKALTAPSILYDYYNPEAHAVVEPTQFTVQ